MATSLASNPKSGNETNMVCVYSFHVPAYHNLVYIVLPMYSTYHKTSHTVPTGTPQDIQTQATDTSSV